MSGLLLLTILLPLVGGIALLLAPRLDTAKSRQVALGVVLVTFVLSLAFLFGFDRSAAGYQFTNGTAGALGWSWIELPTGPGIRLAFGLDGVSMPLFVLTTLLMIPSVFASWSSITERSATFYGFLLLLEAGLLGLFASLDVVLFYIFFEFTLIPLFFIIGLYGGPQRRRASIYFFLYTLAGSLLTLLGVIALVVVHYNYSPGNVLTFSLPDLTTGLSHVGEAWPEWARIVPYSESAGLGSFLSQPQILIFLLLFAGFAIKVPLFPFHTWLPLAHVEAPTAGSILLAGVLLKVGGYGLIRFNLGMTPMGAEALSGFLLAVSAVAILYGAFTALAQTDVKRLVAYSSVSHMGFITLGLFALNQVGIQGAVIQMINHGITTGALFACVGIVYERYHTREMSQLGGLWQRFPLFAFFLILSSLGSAAVPGLNGFVGEFPILVGTFAASPAAAIVSAIGMVLGAYYLLTMIQRLLFGPVIEPAHGDDHGHGHAEHAPAPIRWYETAGLTPLMVLIVVIGLFPNYWFDRMSPVVAGLVNNLAAEKALASAAPQVIDAKPGSISLQRGQ